MDPDNIQQKQKYLRQNILESGYDPSDFIVFLEQNENIDHIDIEGWSMKKIQHLVNAYRQYKFYTSKQQKDQPNQLKRKIFTDRESKATKKQQSKSQINASSEKQKINLSLHSLQGGKMVYEKQKMMFYQQQKNKIEYSRYAPLFDYQFLAKCKCTQSQNLMDITEDKLKITVPRFQVIQIPGIFLGLGSKTQFWYTVRSNIKKQTTVKRLLQDFDWLSAALIRLHPYLSLPELCEYKKQMQNPNQIRKIEIEQYMNYLANRQQLLKSNLFYDFLTAHSDKMEKIKKSYDSFGFAKGISLLKTKSGDIQIEYTKKNREFEQNSHHYSKKVISIHEKFTQAVSKAIQSLELASNNVNYLVDYFAELHQAYNQLMNKFPEYKLNEYNEVLISMNNLFHGISDNIRNHSLNLENHLKDYFKFNVLNDKNILRLEKYIKQQQKNYLEYKYNLSRKKERLLLEPEKWDIESKILTVQQINQLKLNKQKAFQIMLPRQTLQQNEIKAWVGFLYTNFAKQFKIYIKQSTWRFALKYKAFAADLLSKDKSYLESLTRFIGDSRKLQK